MCHLFENDLMATRKRSKDTNSYFIARIWSAKHFNLIQTLFNWKRGNLKKYDFQLKTVRKG